MSEKGGNSYKNYSLSWQENGHENNICCREHTNVDVLKKQQQKKIIIIIKFIDN